MAVTRPTPKDIGNYEAKLIGPFTQRQTICLAAGAVPSVAIAFAMKAVNTDVYVILAVVFLIMALPCFLAFGQKLTYGMKPEDFAISFYQYSIISPGVRVYKTVTLDDRLAEKKKADQQKQMMRGKKSRKKMEAEKKKEEEMRKKAEGTRYLSPKYKPYPHRVSKNHKGFK